MTSSDTTVLVALIGGISSTIGIIYGGNKYQSRRVERQKQDPTQQVIESLKYIIKQKDEDNLELRKLLKEAQNANDRVTQMLREANNRLDKLEDENRLLKARVQAVDPTYKGV